MVSSGNKCGVCIGVLGSGCSKVLSGCFYFQLLYMCAIKLLFYYSNVLFSGLELCVVYNPPTCITVTLIYIHHLAHNLILIRKRWPRDIYHVCMLENWCGYARVYLARNGHGNVIKYLLFQFFFSQPFVQICHLNPFNTHTVFFCVLELHATYGLKYT